jgi:hypothetical protein
LPSGRLYCPAILHRSPPSIKRRKGGKEEGKEGKKRRKEGKRVIVFTSNYNPTEWWPNEPEISYAFERRITSIEHVV